MTWTEFDRAEQRILEEAPAGRRNLAEVKLRIARERLASGDDVAAELEAIRRDVAAAPGRRHVAR